MAQHLFLYLFVLFAFAACKSDKPYDINNDIVIVTLNGELTVLEEDLKALDTDLVAVRKVIDDPELSAELRASLRKELLEGDEHQKHIEQWIAYFKVQRKQRHQSLMDRKALPDLEKIATEEAEGFLSQLKQKPLKRPWLDRYRTAIEL